MTRTRRRWLKSLFLIALLCAPRLAVGAADEAEIPLLRELCKPAYEGRGVGTEGNQRAAELLAKRLEDRALVPLEGQEGFLIPFEQGVAVVEDAGLTAVMEDGSREALRYGRDYSITSTASEIDGTFPIALEPENEDADAVLFFDPEAGAPLPRTGAFATMVLPTDTLPFHSLGVGQAAADPGAALPWISMLRPVYERVREAKALEIRHRLSKTTLTLFNVAGVLPGKDRTKAVVVSAHFDGAGDQAGNRLPCALDNASGVAAADLALSQLTAAEPPYDVVIAYTNAEEAGLTGANDLSGMLASRYEALYNLNVDCVGLPGMPFPIQSSMEISRPLCAEMAAFLSRHGAAVIDQPYGDGDQIAFEAAGIPSLVIGTVGSGIIHTANDTMDNLDLGVIQNVADWVAGFILEHPGLHAEWAESAAGQPEAAAEAVAPTLGYNEAMLLDDTLYLGSQRWITYEEALRHHPSLPLPQTFRGCKIEACKIALSAFTLMDSQPGEVVSIDVCPENIMMALASYGDEETTYSLQFSRYQMRDSYQRQAVAGGGYLLKDREIDAIVGIALQRGDYSLYLLDGETDGRFEIEEGIVVHSPKYPSSKVTEDNAAELLADLELTALFDALIAFVQPPSAS